MQTRNFGLRALTLAMAGVLTLGLAACDETKVATPPQPTVLDISPEGPLDLIVGEQITVVANATNLPAGSAIAFASSNPAVATATGTGNSVTVRALTVGTTTITATVTGGQGTVSRAIQVRVRAAGGPAQTDSARISIVSVVDPMDNPIVPANVQGPIFVRVDYTRGAAQRVQVLVNNTVACEQTFGAAATSQLGEGVSAATAAVEFVCPINTARIDPATNAPTFPNGPVVISARLVSSAGATLAQANTAQYTFANRNNIAVSVTTERQGIGGGGLQWTGGSVTISGTPAIFTTGTTIARMSVQAYNDRTNTFVGVAREDADASNGLSVTFPATGTNSLAGVSTDSLQFRITAVTATGQQFTFPVAGGATGEAFTTAALRYDNVAPYAPTFLARFNGTMGNTFVGSAFSFGGGTGSDTIVSFAGAPTGSAGTPERDPGQQLGTGSNAVTVTYAYLPNNTANAAVTTSATQDTLAAAFARGTAVTTGSQVPQATSATAYVLIAAARDAVGNTTYVRAPALFGSDPNAPTIVFSTGTVAENAVNPAGPINVSITEDISGPATNPIRVQAIRTNSAGETCYNVATQAVVDRTTAGACPFIALSTTSVPVPTMEGYYTFNIQAQDVAGNTSATVSRFILVDRTAPTSSVTSVTTSAEQVTLSGTVRDSVDLMQYEARLQFAGGTSFTFAAPVMVSEFGLPAVGSAAASTSVPLIRGLQATTAGGAPGAIFPVTGASLSAFDVAGNFGGGTAATIASPTASNGAANGLTTFQITNTATEICRPGSDNAVCTATTSPVPTTRTLTAVATGTNAAGTTFNNPFTTVYFYREIQPGVYRLIGSTTSGSIETTTTERRYTYTVTLNAADLADLARGDTFDVLAVGVDSERDAIHSQEVTFTLR